MLRLRVSPRRSKASRRLFPVTVSHDVCRDERHTSLIYDGKLFFALIAVPPPFFRPAEPVALPVTRCLMRLARFWRARRIAVLPARIYAEGERFHP